MPDRDKEIERIADQLEELRWSNELIEMNTAKSSSSPDIQSAGKQIADAINNLGGAILPGLLAGGLLGSLFQSRNQSEAKALDLMMELVREFRQKSGMINSIEHLQKTRDKLTYELILERAAVKGATEQDRKDILNELINEEIVLEVADEGEEYLRFDPESSALKAYRDKAQGFYDELSKLSR